MQKFQNIQALRAIAVLSVVLFHLWIVEMKYGGAQTLLTELFYFGMFGVDLFFVISGFVMVSITRGKFQDSTQSIHFLYHRASRIYPTYWVYTILQLGIFLINPSLVNSSQGNRVDILASFLLLPSDILPMVIVGWTLIHEMYFYLVFFLILLMVPEKRLTSALLFWGAVVVIMNLFFSSPNPYAKLVFHPLTIEFISGCFIGLLFYRTDKKVLASGTLLAIASIGLIVAFCGFNLYQHVNSNHVPQGWWRVLILGTPSALLVFCFINLERNGFTLHSLLSKIGDASYSIYLSHVFTLSVCGRMWGAFASDSIFDNVLIIPALFVLTIVAGMVSYRYIEKPLLNYSRSIA